MRRIRFTRDHAGYAPGTEVELEPGEADAFVVWAEAAIYCDQEKPVEVPGEPEILPAEKAITGPARDKMVHAGQVRKK